MERLTFPTRTLAMSALETTNAPLVEGEALEDLLTSSPVQAANLDTQKGKTFNGLHIQR